MPTLADLLRIRGEACLQGGIAVAVVQIHPRIVPEVGFREAELDPVRRFHGQREEREPVLPPPGKGVMGIGILERIVELALQRLRMLADIRDIQVPVPGETEGGRLPGHLAGLAGIHETIGGTVIVQAEDQRESFLEVQLQLIVVIPYDTPLEVEGRNRFITRRFRHLFHLVANTKLAPVRKREGDLGGFEQGHRAGGEAPRHFVGDINADGQAPVRGHEPVLLRAQLHGSGQKDANGQYSFHRDGMLFQERAFAADWPAR